MDPLSVTASIVALLTFAGATLSTGYRVLSTIRDSGNVVATLLAGLAELTGVLTALKSQQESFKANFGSRYQATNVDALLKSSISGCENTVKSARTMLEKIEKCAKLKLATKLHFMKPEIDSLIQEIERQKQIFVLCLGIDTRRKASDLIELQHAISLRIQTIEAGLDAEHHAAREQRHRDNRRKLFAWLPTPGEDRKEMASRLALHGTGDWVTQMPEFVLWKESDDQILRVDGIAGCGKTFLMAHIVDHLRQLPTVVGQRASVAHYFYSFNYSKTDHLAHVFCLLAAQLIRSLPEPETSQAMQFFEECDEGTRLPSLARAQDLIIAIAGEFEMIYILVDALDEAADKVELIDSMMSLLTRSAKIKCLVSSRSGDFELGDILDAIPCIYVTPALLQDDIAKYIRYRVEHGPPRLKKLETTTLVDKLSAKADGMFLWVSCQIDQLARPSAYRNIDEALQRLPPNLFSTYARILKNIAPDSIMTTAKILHWLCHAINPLSLEELIEAIAIEDDSTSLSSLSKLQEPLDALQLCGSLVRLSETTGKVELAHHSVYEFLTSPNAQKDVPDIFKMQRQNLRIQLCKSMLTFLNFTDFNLPSMQKHFDPITGVATGETTSRGIESALLKYAVRNWWRGLLYDTQSLDIVWAQLMAYFDHMTGNFASSILFLRHTDGDYRYPFSMQPSHFCSMHGLPILSKLHTYEIFDIEAMVDDGRTALHIAAENRHLTLVKELVSLGATVDAISLDGRNPLQVALESGDEEIVRFLVSTGAKIDEQFVNGDTALSVAVSNQWQSVIAFLLAEGVNPNTKLAEGKTPLHIAAQVGLDLDMLELLLDSGANLFVGDDNEWTPLHYAAHYGHEEAALVLLGDYADAESRHHSELLKVFTRIGWTPLHAAVQQKHSLIVSLFSAFAKTVSEIFAGAQTEPSPVEEEPPTHSRRMQLSERLRLRRVPSTSKPSGTAFDLSQSSDEDQVTSSRAPIRRRKPPKERRPTPLWLATDQEWGEGILILQRAGVSDNDLRACMAYALHNGKSASVKSLLFESIDAVLLLLDNAREELISTAFQQQLQDVYDANWNDAQLAQLLAALLERNDMAALQMVLINNFALSDPAQALSAQKYKILQDSVVWTVGQGKLEMLEILNDFGADLTARARSQLAPGEGSLLHLSANANSVPITKFLLQHGLMVNDTDTAGVYPLQYATYHDNSELIGLLLDYGANLNVRDFEGRTALHYACRVTSPRAVEVLLDAGIDVDAVDDSKQTALHEWSCTWGTGGTDSKKKREIWDLLLRYGASQSMCDDEGLTALELALMSAIKGGSTSVSAILHMDHDLINVRFGPLKRTALHQVAASCSDPGILELLISWGADLEAEDVDGKTPMQVATADNCQRLINRGARWRT